MDTMNDAVIRRFGEMSFALCEAETLIAAKDRRIKELEDSIKAATRNDNESETGAQEMLDGR